MGIVTPVYHDTIYIRNVIRGHAERIALKEKPEALSCFFTMRIVKIIIT